MGEERARAGTHLTFPSQRDGPLGLPPPAGGEEQDVARYLRSKQKGSVGDSRALAVAPLRASKKQQQRKGRDRQGHQQSEIVDIGDDLRLVVPGRRFARFLLTIHSLLHTNSRRTIADKVRSGIFRS